MSLPADKYVDAKGKEVEPLERRRGIQPSFLPAKMRPWAAAVASCCSSMIFLETFPKGSAPYVVCALVASVAMGAGMLTGDVLMWRRKDE